MDSVRIRKSEVDAYDSQRPGGHARLQRDVFCKPDLLAGRTSAFGVRAVALVFNGADQVESFFIGSDSQRYSKLRLILHCLTNA